MAKSTIAQLAARKAKLEDDLAKVVAEIAARAGETDQPAEPDPTL
jgi:hypothetical protein